MRRTYDTLPTVVASSAVTGAVVIAVGLPAVTLQFFPFGLVQCTVPVGTFCFGTGIAVPVCPVSGTIALLVAMVVITAAMGIRLHGGDKHKTRQCDRSDKKTVFCQHHGMLHMDMDSINIPENQVLIKQDCAMRRSVKTVREGGTVFRKPQEQAGRTIPDGKTVVVREFCYTFPIDCKKRLT